MALKLTWNNIGDLDYGIVGEMIDAALQTAMRDIDDRGEDGAARTVAIEVVMKKNLKAAGKPVEVHVKCQPKLPPTQSGAVITTPVRAGQQVDFLFQPSSPHDPDQPGMFDARDDESEG